MNRYRRTIALAGLISLVGCDCGGDSGRIGGELVVAPAPIGFGDTQLGLVSRVELTFSNPGEGSVTILESRVPAPLTDEVRLEGVPVAIPAKAQHVVSAIFSPSRAGPRRGRLLIRTDSSLTPEVEVTVFAFVSDARLRFSPEVIDFGTVLLGGTATASARVENAGREEVVVQAATLDLETSTEFSTALDARRVLRPGEGFDLTVTYAPIDLGLDEGSVRVVDDAGAPRPARLIIRGEGTESGVVVEPSSLEISGVRVGERRTRSFDLRNIGPDRRVVSRLTVEGAEAFLVESSTATATPFELAPGEVRRVSVIYAPRSAGFQTARVEVAAPNERLAEVELIGRASPAIEPHLEVGPEVIDFGSVEVGVMITRFVTLRNAGGRDLVLSGPPRIDPNDPAFSLLLDVPAPTVLTPGDEHVLGVVFTPSALGPATGRIELGSADPARPNVVVELAGLGSDRVPALRVDGELDFGAVPAGDGVQRSVTLVNEGSVPLTVDTVALSGGVDGRFTVTPPELPRVLAVGASTTFELNFLDSSPARGRWHTELRVGSDDPDAPTHVTPVFAETIAPRSDAAEVELEVVWERSAAIELHVVRPGGQLYDRPGDVCGCNPNPDWGVRFDPSDDPRLDVVSPFGRGPVRLRLPRPAGDHAVVVVRSDGDAADPVLVGVALFLRGERIDQVTRMLTPGQRWDVGTVNDRFWDVTPTPLVASSRRRCF